MQNVICLRAAFIEQTEVKGEDEDTAVHRLHKNEI